MVKEKVYEFIGKYININEIDGDSDIFEEGYVNSLFSMQLILFIEKEFNISVMNDDIEIENFSTINNIINFIMTHIDTAK
jgi:acyl carrier protein